MMDFLTGVLLFVLHLLLFGFVLIRWITVPATLLVIEPTQLARRFLHRSRNEKTKAVLDINVEAKDLERIMNGWLATGIAVGISILTFLLEHHIGFLFLAFAFILPRLTASSDAVDERRFEQFTRSLAATSDAAIIGTLLLAMVFRFSLDAFVLLAFVFLAREVLLVLARRWLESEPEFDPHDDVGLTINLGDGIKAPQATIDHDLEK
jgi:hypothetical protein